MDKVLLAILVVVILIFCKDIFNLIGVLLLPRVKEGYTEAYRPDEFQEDVYDMKKNHMVFRTKPTKPLTFLDEGYINAKQPYSDRSDTADELNNIWTLYQGMVGNIVN